MSEGVATHRKHIPAPVLAAIGVAAAFILAIVVIEILGNASARRWQRYSARLRSTGLPLTFEEIEAQRLSVPEELNGARIIENLIPDLETLGAGGRPYDQQRKLLIFGFPEADFFRGIPKYTLETSRQFILQHTALLEKLETLRDRPTGRFKIEFAVHPHETLLPHTRPVRIAARLMDLHAVLDLTEGDTEAAARTVFWQHRLAATLNDEPFLISRLVQISIDNLAVQRLEQILRVGELDAPTLLRLDDTLAQRLNTTTMRWAWLGERACLIALFGGVAAGTISTSAVFGVPVLPDAVVLENQMHCVEMITWLVEADGPREMLAAARRIDTGLRRSDNTISPTHILAQKAMWNPHRAVILHQRSMASLRCARVAVAAERHRLRTDRLPESIDFLVPEFLDAIPEDPFTGEPLRFVQTEDGIVIYAVDENLEDDGGSVVEREGAQRPADVGFRLFKPERRGILLTDEPLPED